MKNDLALMILILFSISANAAPANHISVTGIVFTRDDSNPSLGEAYSRLDEKGHGIIWGDAVKTPDGLNTEMTLQDGIKYCQSIDARLPTKDEFVQLWRDLGWGTSSDNYDGYSPYTKDDPNSQVLPHLAGTFDSFFWSSTADQSCSGSAWFFEGGYGPYFGLASIDHYCDNAFAVRCVIRK